MLTLLEGRPALRNRSLREFRNQTAEARMTRHEPFPKGSELMSPPRTLRGWLDRLAATDRLCITRPGVGLVHDLAAIAKHLDGTKATFFPHPDGHRGSVVSGLVSDRGWMA